MSGKDEEKTAAEGKVELVTVLFTLLPDGFEHESNFPSTHTVADVKRDVGEDLRVGKATTVRLEMDKVEVNDDDTLESIGLGPGTSCRMTLIVGNNAAADSGGIEGSADGGEFPEEIEVTVTFGKFILSRP